MDDLSFKKATLIGHSMGGRAVMLVAHRFVSQYLIKIESLYVAMAVMN